MAAVSRRLSDLAGLRRHLAEAERLAELHGFTIEGTEPRLLVESGVGEF